MKRYNYFMRLLIAIDQFFNVLLFNGSEDHTISGRAGYMAVKTQKWYWIALRKFIDALFFFDKNHCHNSVEWDEVRKSSTVEDLKSRRWHWFRLSLMLALLTYLIFN
ncbi:hypothetical protein [Pseudoalteromonas sp. Of7M-16]|uniref:hypothetical protein n=1 Tax=Pseudoalteromonas sp. Of7M-16 TaxID=2917756 RepID=UPI001EF7273E|nr:hypothetical protein [Pseudoalteromonas sp. Of7M-16]MCG7550935.1 hypothetical protein [Pseudoalteromonas sp. Of7M-16]